VKTIRSRRWLLAVALIALAGCSTDDVKRATYEGLYQKSCNDRTGEFNCDPDHRDYEQYKKERDEALKQ